MTPEEFCKYVIDGNIFSKIPSYEANFSELGCYIWPERYSKLVTLAKDAILTTVEADAQKPCPICSPRKNSTYVANYCFLCGRDLRAAELNR